jgi:hypothetical protein
MSWTTVTPLAGQALLASVFLFAGCANKTAAPVQPPVESSFALKLTPAVLLEGSDVRITCNVPESYGRGRIRVALEGIVASERAIESIQTRVLATQVPCGTWVATCQIRTARGEEIRTQALVARGSCNADEMDGL